MRRDAVAQVVAGREPGPPVEAAGDERPVEQEARQHEEDGDADVEPGEVVAGDVAGGEPDLQPDVRDQHAQCGECPHAVEAGEPSARRAQPAGRVGGRCRRRGVLGVGVPVVAVVRAVAVVVPGVRRSSGAGGLAMAAAPSGPPLGVPGVPAPAHPAQGGVERDRRRDHQRQLGRKPEAGVPVDEGHHHDDAAHDGDDAGRSGARRGAGRSARWRRRRRCRTRPPSRSARARSPSGRPTGRAAAAPGAGTGRTSAPPGPPPRTAHGRGGRGRTGRRSRGTPCPGPRRRPRAPGARSPGCTTATSSRPGRPRRRTRSWRCRTSGRAGPTTWSAPRSGTCCTRPTAPRRRPPRGRRPRAGDAHAVQPPAAGPTRRPRGRSSPAGARRTRHQTSGTASSGPSRIDSDRTSAATPITRPKTAALRIDGRSHQR